MCLQIWTSKGLNIKSNANIKGYAGFFNLADSERSNFVVFSMRAAIALDSTIFIPIIWYCCKC